MSDKLKELLTPRDLQLYLSCSKNTVYNLLQNTNIPKITIGRRYYIPKDELNDWLRKNIGGKIILQ